MYSKSLSAILATLLCISSAQAEVSYDEWAKNHSLTGAQANPKANPDNDRFNNALEYTFGTDPLKADNPADVSPALVVDGSTASFQYRIDKNSKAKLRVLQSSNLKNWTPAPGVPAVTEASSGQLLVSHTVSPSKEFFYVLEAEVHSLVSGDTVVTVGTNVGSDWDGLPVIPQADILLTPPAVGGNGTDSAKPDYTRFPVTAGATQGAFTQNYLENFKTTSKAERPPLRSWMGWFLWGNGTPPANINPGIFSGAGANSTSSNGTTYYNDQAANPNWDYNAWQYQSQTTSANGTQSVDGQWRPVRVDQQPLYLTPLTLNYNMAPGMFGYRSKPFSVLDKNTYYFYWRDKSIVRGVNISSATPFLYQQMPYNYLPSVTQSWKQTSMILSSIPLETTVIVPGNVPPVLTSTANGTCLTKNGTFNVLPDGTFDPFPYPVWDANATAAEQTPFAIQVDRIGDFDADLIWEGVNPRLATGNATQQAYYNKNRYKVTNGVGSGNYMKMTVAQGSPFVWCETSNSAYATFYNLIRANLPGLQGGNTTLTGAATLGKVYNVTDKSGAKTGVSYVLLYGNQVNPNQVFQAFDPLYANTGGGANNDQNPGGFNPPPVTYITAGNSTTTPPGQDNFTYTAVFFRTDTVKPVQVGPNGKNAGTDALGNPYFFLEFKNPAKNWFVVAGIPPMRYYHTQLTRDPKPARDAMAAAWANELGKYAFNFLTSSKVGYSVTNMFQTTTNYSFTSKNPYLSANVTDAARMTTPGQTVFALNPHQYQPLTLGPDLTKAPAGNGTTSPQVVWNPLVPGFGSFIKDKVVSTVFNANKSAPNLPQFYDYWNLRGNLKSIVTPGFKTVYPFQNFLPVMPPPDYSQNVAQSGIAGVYISDPGDSTNKLEPPTARITIPPTHGTGTNGGNITATFTVVLDSKGSGKVDQITIDNPGNGYPLTPPAGDPTNTICPIEISPPIGNATVGTMGTRAEAYVQTGSTGQILAVFMKNQGSGYASLFTATQKSGTGEPLPTDPPVITPSFDKDTGALLAGPAFASLNGAGFDFSRPESIDVKFFGNGSTLPKFEIFQPGNLMDITAPTGSTPGVYLSGDPTKISVHIPPPSPSATPQTAKVTAMTNKTAAGKYSIDFNPATSGGNYTVKPRAYITDLSSNSTVDLVVSWNPPTGGATAAPVIALGAGADAVLSGTTNVTFTTPSPGNQTITNAAATVTPTNGAATSFVIFNQGNYSAPPTGAHFVDSLGLTRNVTVNMGGSSVASLLLPDPNNIYLSSPVDVVFEGGNATTAAVAKVYPQYLIKSVALSSPLVGGYSADQQLSFTTSAFTDNQPGVTIPEPIVNIPATGNVTASSINVTTQPGAGLPAGPQPQFQVLGGAGFDAVLQTIVSPITNNGTAGGEVLAVKVLYGGTNYVTTQPLYGFYAADPGSSVAGSVAPEFRVNLDANGAVLSIDVTNPGKLMPSGSLQLTTLKPPYANRGGRNPGAVYDSPKGYPASFNTVVSEGKITGVIQIPPPAECSAPPRRYVQGSFNKALVNTGPTYIAWVPNNCPFVIPNSDAGGYMAQVAPPNVNLGQSLYNSFIATYSNNYASAPLKPFGGAYMGTSATDAYGLGATMGAATTFVSDIFSMQQTLGNATSTISLTPFASSAAQNPADTFSYPVFQRNSPAVDISNALKSSVQGIQQSLSLLFVNPPSTNNPTDRATTWAEKYFNIYDGGVGRLILNPTQTQPGYGPLSSMQNPPAMSPDENDAKTGLSRWWPGMSFVGFGNNDQWNDAHYFFGYYLASAGLAGILDKSWEPSISSKPASLWSGPGQMGSAIEQMLLTLAFDPDNEALNKVLYRTSGLTYQKFAFFDQWNGHSWATGAQPGPVGAVYDYASDLASKTEVNFWKTFGTGPGGDLFKDENENSIFEGIQAWSGEILWGGATDRKAVVDQGIYLYSTALAAADAYFLDKNYNQIDSPQNKYSWVPVTTFGADQVPKGDGNLWPKNTSYARANPAAYYTAYSAFADQNGTEVSPGMALMRKAENQLNTFFAFYPVGPKVIQAFPVRPWTLGIARNSSFMKKWAGAMMRPEWLEQKPFFSDADWYVLSMLSALCGVPYNPGDVPYTATGERTKVQPLAQRLVSSWITPNASLAAPLTVKTVYDKNSILTFLLSLDKYGTPDWTYIARATDSKGKDDNSSIIFTAAFSKQTDAKSVTTTFVAFNPGWTTRYAVFQRLNLDGTINTAGIMKDPKTGKAITALPVPPKKMVTLTMTFPVK